MVISNENDFGTRRRAAVRAATVLALVAGCVGLALAPVGMQSDQSAQGAALGGPVLDAPSVATQPEPPGKRIAPAPSGQHSETGARSPANNCGAPHAGGVLPAAGGTLAGDTWNAGDNFNGGLYPADCGYSYGPSGNDEIWEFTVEGDGRWTFDTCTIPAMYDTSLGITKDVGIGCPGVGVVCNGDDPCGSYGESAIRDVCLSAGVQYWLIVDGWSPASEFPGTYYDVTYARTTDPCSTDADCDDGEYCNGIEVCVGACCETGPPACPPWAECDPVTQECVAQAATRSFKFKNGKDKNLIGFSKTFDLMSNESMSNDTTVHRWDSNQQKWVEESGWTSKATQKPPGTWTLQVDIDGAAPVPKDTKLKYTVTTSTDTPGIWRGTDRKYPPDEDDKKEKGVRGYNPWPADPKFPGEAGTIHTASVDSLVHFADGARSSVLGVTIPANHYAYFYQLNSESGAELSELQIYFTGMVTDSGVLSFPHNGELEFDYWIDEDDFTEDLDPDDPIWLINPPQPVALMEELGVVPGVDVLWTIDDGFARGVVSSLSPGQSSNIVYLISLDPPVRDGLQAHVTDLASHVSVSMAWAPFQAEPIPTLSQWGLIVITLLALTAGTVVFGRRRRPAVG